MLIDDVVITIHAGKGGDGAVGFNKLPGAKGPTGASGGRGGSVYLEGVSDLGALNQFRFKKEVSASSGGGGDKMMHDGKNGDDLVVRVPVGTVVHFEDMAVGLYEEIVGVGERILIAKGGRGGKGNFHFRSSRNTSPKEAEKGRPGEVRSVRLELKLIADVGFIGLPSAGKTSLLNALTNTNKKVANYPFTTLEPNIGVYENLILADIPGIIEGASGGRGLGIKFLRHIERTKILFHLIAADCEDPCHAYSIIRTELEKHSAGLVQKKEYVFLSKSDTLSPKECEEKLVALKTVSPSAEAFSLYDKSIKKVTDVLQIIIKEKII
ncbi:MAG: GTPase ObgE [Candidatus Paceibacterota bacterium]